MTITQLQTQQVQLLAQKALKLDEIKNIDAALSQIGAVLQYAAENAPTQDTPAE